MLGYTASLDHFARVSDNELFLTLFLVLNKTTCSSDLFPTILSMSRVLSLKCL